MRKSWADHFFSAGEQKFNKSYNRFIWSKARDQTIGCTVSIIKSVQLCPNNNNSIKTTSKDDLRQKSIPHTHHTSAEQSDRTSDIGKPMWGYLVECGERWTKLSGQQSKPPNWPTLTEQATLWLVIWCQGNPCTDQRSHCKLFSLVSTILLFWRVFIMTGYQLKIIMHAGPTET